MNTIKKYLFLSVALPFLALAGCGGGGGGGTSNGDGNPAQNPAPAPVTDPLQPGGTGVVLTPVTDPTVGGSATASFSLAVALNDASQIVGYAETAASSEFRAAVWNIDAGGAATAAPVALPPLANHTFSAAFAIDEAGQVVGESRGPLGFSGVIWKSSAAATALPPLLGGRGSTAYGISPDGGFIVGEAEDINFNVRAVLWKVQADGSIDPPVALPVALFTKGTNADPLPSSFSSASAVNDNGWVAGVAEDGEGISHAVLWRPSGAAFITTDLRGGGEEGSAAYAINSAGQVSGEAELTVNEFSAVLWADDGTGQFKRSVLEGGATAADINDSGRVAGAATAAPLATVWDGTTALFTRLFETESQAYAINNLNLVVGRDGSVGFVKRVD